MSLTIILEGETERKLVVRSARSGEEPERFVRRLVERELAGKPSIDEILAPFRREVAQSGMSDADLDQLFERSICEVRSARRASGQ